MKKILPLLSILLFSSTVTAQESNPIPPNPFEEPGTGEEPEPTGVSENLAEVESEPPTTVLLVDTTYSHNQRYKATRAILNHLELENGGYVGFCRGENAPMGCEPRVETLVNLMFDMASRNHLDPWVFIGLAVESTNFNPFHIGRRRATGIMGIPHNHRYRRTEQFFTDVEYRQSCREQEDACQSNIIEQSARLLADSIARCSDNLSGGLQRYNDGSCNANARFSRHVLRHARLLQEYAATLADINICEIDERVCNDPLFGLEEDI